MATRFFVEIFARHEGPYIPIVYMPEGKGFARVERPRTMDPIPEARAMADKSGLAVYIWSVPEQQFATVVRPGNLGDAAPRPAAEIGPQGMAVVRKARGGEWAPAPNVRAEGLPKAQAAVMSYFITEGSGTPSSCAIAIGSTTDRVASHCSRLRAMGLLLREGK